MVARLNRQLAGLAALDAVAVALATIAAFALGTAVHHYDSLETGHVMSLAFPAVFVCIALTLPSLWAAGLYGEHAAEASFVAIAGALAWAMVPLAFGAVYWEWAPEAPLMVIVSGFMLALALLCANRALLRRRS